MENYNDISPPSPPASGKAWKIGLALAAAVFVTMAAWLALQVYDRISAAFFFAEGNKHFAAGNYPKAIREYDKAIERFTKSSGVYYKRGIAHKRIGNYDRAFEDYTRTIELSPDNAFVYNDRGNILSNKGQFEKAIEDYTRAIELNPKFDWPYRNRASCYRTTGRLDLAIQDDTQAIAINPRYYKAYRDRGICYFCKGGFAQAEVDFSASLSIKPGQELTNAWLYIAVARQGKDGTADLRAYADTMADKDAVWHVIRMYLGEITPDECLAQEKDKSESGAKAYDPAIDFYIGEYYFLRGDREKAAHHYERFINVNETSHFEYMMAKHELERLD